MNYKSKNNILKVISRRDIIFIFEIFCVLGYLLNIQNLFEYKDGILFNLSLVGTLFIPLGIIMGWFF